MVEFKLNKKIRSQILRWRCRCVLCNQLHLYAREGMAITLHMVNGIGRPKPGLPGTKPGTRKSKNIKTRNLPVTGNRTRNLRSYSWFDQELTG